MNGQEQKAFEQRTGIQFVSASKLKQYDLCPHRQKNEPFSDSDATRFGDAVHHALAHVLRTGNHTEFYNAFVTRAGANNLTDYASAANKERAEKCFRNVVESDRLNLNPDMIVTIEDDGFDPETDVEYNFNGVTKRFFQAIIVPDQWGIRGSFDYVDWLEDGTLRIIDWKTGQGEEKDDFQLACYALSAWRRWGATKIEVGFFYLEKGLYKSWRWDEATLTGAFEAVNNRAVRFLAEKEWAQTPNKFCSYCTLKSGCKAYKAMLEKPAKASEFEIEEKLENLPAILERLERAESIEKAAGSLVRDLTAKRNRILLAHGAQKVGDRMVECKEVASTYTYNVVEIFSKLEQILGRPPFEIIDFSSGGFDELLKKIGPDLDKDTKKLVKALKTDHRVINKKAVRFSASIAKEAAGSDAEEGEETAA